MWDKPKIFFKDKSTLLAIADILLYKNIMKWVMRKANLIKIRRIYE